MRRYETIFILRPDLGESAQKDSIKRFEGLIGSSGGEIIETEEWGFRELAYNIKGERRGFYVRLDYGGNGATMNEVERNLKLSDGVLRYLSVLVAEEVDPANVRAELEAHRRRTAEARAAAEAARAAAEAARAAAAAGPSEEAESQGAPSEGGDDFSASAGAAAEEPAATASDTPDGEGEQN
ncbi:MAG TPA: 30S ribosomal protein S6 [Candidatus Binataceae bacterium]|nr:30S ribosomal protein S6 [Candidatus Binataceae bacterium]